jgi:putative GTP pyrophosphokinase
VATRTDSTQTPEKRFSKGQVNRAGDFLLDLRERMLGEGPASAVADTDGDELEQAWEALTWWRSRFARPLSNVSRGLRYHVDEGGGRVRGRIEVTQRLKRMDTLIDKLGRELGNVTQMHDIGGVRAVLPRPREVYVVRRRLLKSWTIIKERDYIADPKSSGYRAVHLIVSRYGMPIEVQLRTFRQDAWANLVEEQSRQQGVGFKFGAGPADTQAYLARVAELLAAVDREEMSPRQFDEALKGVR